MIERLRRLERLRQLELCLIAPAVEPGWRKAFFVSRRRRACVRSLPPGRGGAVEIDAGIASAAPPASAEDPLTAGEAEDLCSSRFHSTSSSELAVLPLDLDRIAEQLSRRHLPRAA